MNLLNQPLIQSLKPEEVNLSTLQTDTFFDFSFPADSDHRLKQAEKFAAFPLITIAPDNIIVAGVEFYRLLQSRNIQQAIVLTGKLTKGESLCLNYNISNALFSLNLLEKLMFAQRIITVFETNDIYRRVDLDININKKLRSKLDILLQSEFQHLLSHDLINLKTALRICDMAESDRLSIIELFKRIPFTSSQCLHILEMFEEICFRDKTSVSMILETVEIEKFYQEKKPQQSVLQIIGKLRYPMYSQEEKEWQIRLKQLNLPANIKVNHSPFFEKKNVELTATLKDFEQLENFSKKFIDD